MYQMDTGDDLSPRSVLQQGGCTSIIICAMMHSQVCYVRIQFRLGHMCGFQECDKIATPSAGFSCAACVTNTSAAVTSDLLLCLVYSCNLCLTR